MKKIIYNLQLVAPEMLDKQTLLKYKSLFSGMTKVLLVELRFIKNGGELTLSYSINFAGFFN